LDLRNTVGFKTVSIMGQIRQDLAQTRTARLFGLIYQSDIMAPVKTVYCPVEITASNGLIKAPWHHRP